MLRYGSAVVICKGNEVLLVRHGDKSRHLTGVYTLPSGEKELYDHDFEDTAVREVREETGLEITRQSLSRLGHFDSIVERKRGEESVSLYLYTCDSFTGELKKQNETEPVWVEIAGVLSGKYPMPRMSGNLSHVVNEHLRNHLKK